MKNLLELRDEIDVIDKQIVALYQQRMQIAAEVAEYKIETGKKVFDKDREMEKLATLSALGDSAFNRHGIRELFEQIMSISRKRQYQLMTDLLKAHGMARGDIKEDFSSFTQAVDKIKDGIGGALGTRGPRYIQQLDPATHARAKDRTQQLDIAHGIGMRGKVIG